MTSHILHRIEPARTNLDLVRLGEGLALHLRYAGLVSLLIRAGDRQQAYLSGAGCNGCAGGRCLPGCRLNLLRRLLRTCGGDLRPITRGLVPRPYTRAALAWPGAAAEPLDAALLTGWDEARLVLNWRSAARSARVAALLLAGDGGPQPAEPLRAAGWRAIELPRCVAAGLARVTTPATPPAWQAWKWPPFILLNTPGLPAPDTPPPARSNLNGKRDGQHNRQHGSAQSVPAAAPVLEHPPPALLERATATLRAVLEGAPVPAPQPCGINEQMAGRAPTAAEALAGALPDLIACIVASPRLTGGPQRSQVGLTPGRLQKELRLSKTQAQALMLWLDQARALDEPRQGADRWNAPRPLCEHDAVALLARLQTIAPPDTAAIAAAFEEHR